MAELRRTIPGFTHANNTLARVVKDVPERLLIARKVALSDWFDFTALYKAMIYRVVWSSIENVKIVRLVVFGIFVNMMNDFTLGKISTNNFFNNQPMFRYVSLVVPKRVVRGFNFYVVLCGCSFAAVPLVMRFHSKITNLTLVPRYLYSFLSFVPRRSFCHTYSISNLTTYTAHGK